MPQKELSMVYMAGILISLNMAILAVASFDF